MPSVRTMKAALAILAHLVPVSWIMANTAHGAERLVYECAMTSRSWCTPRSCEMQPLDFKSTIRLIDDWRVENGIKVDASSLVEFCSELRAGPNRCEEYQVTWSDSQLRVTLIARRDLDSPIFLVHNKLAGQSILWATTPLLNGMGHIHGVCNSAVTEVE